MRRGRRARGSRSKLGRGGEPRPRRQGARPKAVLAERDRQPLRVYEAMNEQFRARRNFQDWLRFAALRSSTGGARRCRWIWRRVIEFDEQVEATYDQFKDFRFGYVELDKRVRSGASAPRASLRRGAVGCARGAPADRHPRSVAAGARAHRARPAAPAPDWTSDPLGFGGGWLLLMSWTSKTTVP